MSAPDEDYDELVYHVPKQKKPPASLDKMGAAISLWPPLGQVTQVQKGNIGFVALLEVPADQANQTWEVALWHSAGGDWSEAILSPAERTPSTLQPLNDSSSRAWFQGAVPVKHLLHFTVKYRSGPEQEWRWIRDEHGVGDGTVILSSNQTTEALSDDFGNILKGYNPSITVKPCQSQCPGTRLWTLEASVEGAKGEDSTFADLNLGLPWGGFLRWFALIRIWAPWLAPRHGKTKFELDKDAVLSAFVNSDGQHLVLLAVSGINDVMALFRSDDSGNVQLHLRNDGEDAESTLVLAAIGHNFESANAAVMYQARQAVVTSKKLTGELNQELKALQEGVKPEWMENWYDGLGFCTWNALGQRLTDEKVLNAVDELTKHNIKVTSLIIDDNWQNIDYRGEGQFQYGWNDFEAEPKAFPNGLKDVVTKIRTTHPHIQHVAVWHALLGYWAGLSPDGNIAKTYKTEEVIREDQNRRWLPLGGKMTVVSKEDVHKFYNDFYKFLSDSGIDGVKTDAQFMTDTWVSAKARRELITEYLDAWTISSLRHFSINLFTQHLNILPDWDMFQTVHDYSGLHAAARCVSGGPIYITDVPGQHNIDLINQMTGITPRGKTVIFRPSVLGRSIDQYVGYHDDSLLKVGCYHGRAVTGTPILGVFNISARKLTDIIPLDRFSGVLPSLHYIIRAHTTGLITTPVQTSHPGSKLTVSLDVRDYEILTAYALSPFESDSLGRVQVANLGLIEKMTGAAAIVSSGSDYLENGRVLVDTRLKALGVLGIYISRLPDMSLDDDFMATIQGQVIPRHTVSVNKTSSSILEIDIEKAWKELDLKPGWSNEVEVKVYFDIEK
ncbi:putative glycoside hydrolase family 36 protein [Diaporthe ampelina]|uniref:Putative glycoside hydrolase family 36 protein n=1 Tax=Diaporthe ampelina TaxID=1214573 RepID=A0A0G2H3G6_9PEZI|nr:putative glycoside hydrolase family 36 protein [Diaporthe ampelina]